MIIFYDNMSNDMISQMIEHERLEIQNKQDVFSLQKKTLLLYMQKITDSLEKTEEIENTDDILGILSNLKSFLDQMHEFDSIFEKLLSVLDNLSTENGWTIETADEYNTNLTKLQKSWETYSTDFENFTQSILSSFNFLFPNETCAKSSIDEYIEQAEENITDNKCLLISENKVFLPYKVKDLEAELEKNRGKYSNLEHLIRKRYIIPSSRFKPHIIARFREAFNLMRNKENSSLWEAFNLAFELSVNSTLNPAVIAACANKTELDIYLDCLYEQELEQFSIFEIKYEINPTI